MHDERLRIASSSKTTPAQLEELAAIGELSVVAAVVVNPNTPPPVVEALVSSWIESGRGDELVAAAVADPRARHYVMKHLPDLMRGRLDGLPGHEGSFRLGATLCSRRDAPSEQLLAMLADAATSEAFREAVARETTRPDVQNVLRLDPSESVRAAVASGPYQPVELRLNLMIDLSDRLAGREVMAAGMGADETVALLLAEPGPLPERASLPSVLAGWRDPVRRVLGAVLASGDEVRTIAIDTVVGYCSHIQPLSDGGFLIAELGTGRGPEPNANRYDSAGRLVGRFRFGHMITGLSVDRADRVWIGYGDEGIFGDPLSAAGLSRYDGHTGERQWSYSAPAGISMISECWALNVGDEATWAYCEHLDNALVRVSSDDSCRMWTTDSGAASALVTDGRQVLLIGYLSRPVPRGLCEIWELGPDRLEKPRPVIFVPAVPLGFGSVFARGPIIYCVDGARVFRGDIRDIRDVRELGVRPA
jgi:hypothetical protein